MLDRRAAVSNACGPLRSMHQRPIAHAQPSATRLFKNCSTDPSPKLHIEHWPELEGQCHGRVRGGPHAYASVSPAGAGASPGTETSERVHSAAAQPFDMHKARAEHEDK